MIERSSRTGRKKREPPSTLNRSVLIADENDDFPGDKLTGEALGTFCELRAAIRRAQECRRILCKHLALPVGYAGWDHERPKLDSIIGQMDLLRPLYVLLSPLRQKERYAPIEAESYHDRAIKAATPLIDALASIQLEDWQKKSVSQRFEYAWKLPEIDEYHIKHYVLSFAFAEAERASKWMKELSPKDFRIFFSGSYACRRLDAISELGSLNELLRRERIVHMGTLMTVANDIGLPRLAKEIHAEMHVPTKRAQFVFSAIYDELKGNLVDAINRIVPPDEFSKRVRLSQDMVLPGSKLVDGIDIMLDRIRSDGDGPDDLVENSSGVPEATYLTPGDCIRSLPLGGLTIRQQRHQLDRIRNRLPWIRKNERGYLHEDDWRKVVAMLKKRSYHKLNVSDAIESLAPDPSPEQINAMKAEIESSKLSVKRSRN